MQTPLIIKNIGGDFTIAKTQLMALFDEKPTMEDIDEASRSMGFDPRSYIVGEAECNQVDDVASEEHGLWRASWSCILD
jgi:hypothetical protein